MSFLYFDCFSGISGDMMIGALLDGGASFEDLENAISSLSISAKLSYVQKVVQGIRCTSFDVDTDGAPIRHLADIDKIITGSGLSPDIKSKSINVFNRLAAAEGHVHGVSPASIHFHEIGAVDTIVDIVGTFICLDSLGIEEVYTSALPWANGFIDISHGRYPLPAPAAAHLLSGFPCFFCDAGIELVTPTGAALITSIASPLLNPPPFVPIQIAYGAGDHVREDKVPNLLRMVKADFTSAHNRSESVAVLETEVDDLNPEVFTHLHNLFTSHPYVFDYFTTPVYMKKNRPGTLITLIAHPDYSEMLAHLLIKESGSLGVRFRIQDRYTAPRSECQIETPWGSIRVKVARQPDGNIHTKPEFEDCQSIANQHNISLLEVYSVVNALASRLSK